MSLGGSMARLSGALKSAATRVSKVTAVAPFPGVRRLPFAKLVAPGCAQ